MRQLIGIIIAIGMAGIAPPFIMGIELIGIEVIAALMKSLLFVPKRLQTGYITRMEGIIAIRSVRFNTMIS
jgi:hypothetical protein